MESIPSTASPRWRSNLAADDLTAESRRTSNISSSSSDILVAPLPQLQPTAGHLQRPTPTTSMASLRTFAGISHGRILRVVFGPPAAREKLRAIDRSTPKPQLQNSNSISSHLESDDGDDNHGQSEADTDGLDPNMTYSKEETLRHPGVEFVHRGQGRYRMVAAIKNLSPATVARPTRYVFIVYCRIGITNPLVDKQQSAPPSSTRTPRDKCCRCSSNTSTLIEGNSTLCASPIGVHHRSINSPRS